MNLNLRKGASSRVAITVALTAIILISIFGALEYAQVADLESENRSLSSSVSELQAENQNLSVGLSGSSNGSELVQTWLYHLAKLQSANTTEALDDYAPNATVVWSGDIYGWGGNFTGTSEIGTHLQDWFQSNGVNTFVCNCFVPANLYLRIESFNSTSTPSGTAGIGATLFFAGSSHLYGAFNGTVSTEYQYFYQNGGWLISQEHWSFETFDIQYSVGA